MRRRAKVDANQAQIVQALRKVGATVLHLHPLGRGAPDILAGYRGRNILMEIKSAKGKLTPQEAEFMWGWKGQYCEVRTVQEALLAIRI